MLIPSPVGSPVFLGPRAEWRTRGEPPPGRYYAEYVQTISEEPREQLQALLDEKDRQEWYLAGVVGGLPTGGVIFLGYPEAELRQEIQLEPYVASKPLR